jgi:hypothetical protein
MLFANEHRFPAQLFSRTHKPLHFWRLENPNVETNLHQLVGNCFTIGLRTCRVELEAWQA